MKNYEKYADEIKREHKVSSGYFCSNFIMPHILKKDSCAGINCEHCHMLQMLWLLEEYEEQKEQETDWSKVKVDTPILVKEIENKNWIRGYFAKYEDGKVYAWSNGRTSWTTSYIISWKYAKLVENKEPEVDWSKVEVDTPIYW